MKRLLAVFVCTLLLAVSPFGALAEESPGRARIVYLLDASNSMNTNDPQRLAPDAINQMVRSVPSNADIGFVAFNDGVAANIPLTGASDREKLARAVSETVYTGYTDAGSALEAAVGMLSGGSNAQKYIIIISDGESAKAYSDTCSI